MHIQRLRNLTTGRLHTEMAHIYEDIEYLTGVKGIMTHSLPNAYKALIPYLEEKTIALHPRLWDGAYDTEHTGELDIKPMGKEHSASFWVRFAKLPIPF